MCQFIVGLVFCIMSVTAPQVSVGESQKQIYTEKKFSDLSDCTTEGHEFCPLMHPRAGNTRSSEHFYRYCR